ncbi:MAG TPA: Fe-S cluster assembly protein SufD [Gammaproteobacteria bacterium]|jgi:Fe-S cluster assembly protein SufD|nr:Fe-S cluster assembly protein SufD [Gammaproteobacteria bacterium]
MIFQSLPTRQHERWKYANLQFLKDQALGAPGEANAAWVRSQIENIKQTQGQGALVLVLLNGEWAPHYSDALPAGCDVSLLEKINLVIDEKAFPVAALQQREVRRGLKIQLQAKQNITLHLLSLVSSASHALVNPMLVLHLDNDARLQLMEHVASDNQAFVMINHLTQVTVGERAHFDWVKIQTLPFQATLFAHHDVNQQKDSLVNFVNISHGARFARDEMQVTLAQSGAVCKTAGFYQTEWDAQFVDNHLDIIHAAPHTESDMLYKGILDKKSQAVFNGRLNVQAGAQKISAHQANHHLLLSNDAEAYSKPELEIYADDVKCKHGATTGQLDEDALFYLQSRGIEKSAAQAMLMAGFMDEVIARIPNETLRAYLKANRVSA